VRREEEKEEEESLELPLHAEQQKKLTSKSCDKPEPEGVTFAGVRPSAPQTSVSSFADVGMSNPVGLIPLRISYNFYAVEALVVVVVVVMMAVLIVSIVAIIVVEGLRLSSVGCVFGRPISEDSFQSIESIRERRKA